MTTFTTDGFLSDEIAGVTSDFTARYASELDLVSQTNQLAHKLLYGIRVRPDLVPDLLLAILVARQIESFQAFVALLRIGLVSQAEIIIRTLAETMFLVGAIRKDAGFAAKYVLADEISRRRSLVRLSEERSRRGVPPDEEVEALIKELEARIKDEKIQKLSTEQIADIAGLEAYYDTVYGAFSMAVHSSIRSLERVLVPDAEGSAISIDYSPVLDKLEMHLDFALDMTLIVLVEAAAHFNGDAKAVNELRQQLKNVTDGRKAG